MNTTPTSHPGGSQPPRAPLQEFRRYRPFRSRRRIPSTRYGASASQYPDKQQPETKP